MKSYPGAKANSGIIQFLINKIPYHERYFELFAGSAQLFKNKKPAIRNYLNDLDPKVFKWLHRFPAYITNYPAISFLAGKEKFTRNDFIYLDPPYPKQDRRSGAKIYKFEMMDEKDHCSLLLIARDIDANIMISTGTNDLYPAYLPGWNRYEFKTMGHRGPRIEVIYTNYPEPELLHQYDFYGDNFTRRQQIKRISERFRERLTRIHKYEKHIIIKDIIKHYPEEIKHFIKDL